MRFLKAHWLTLLFVVASFVLSGVVYPRLPATLPTHWNIHGEVDGTMEKAWGAFLLPLLLVFMVGLLWLFPRISPKGFDVTPFQRAYDTITTAIVAGLFCLHGFILLAALGVAVPIERAVPTVLGVMIMVLGNVMGKVTRNFFVGIRTPWTLANDEVWARTHRLAGRTMVTGGLLSAVAALVGAPFVLTIGAVLVAVLLPAAYSWVLYRRLEGKAA